jgi:hypothetical protein
VPIGNSKQFFEETFDNEYSQKTYNYAISLLTTLIHFIYSFQKTSVQSREYILFQQNLLAIKWRWLATTPVFWSAAVLVALNTLFQKLVYKAKLNILSRFRVKSLLVQLFSYLSIQEK